MIELTKQQWTNEAAAGLAVALGIDLPIIAEQVKAGICELWRVGENGYVVTRFELLPEPELVLVAGEGFADGANGYIESVKAFCNVAANAGAKSVRIHTERGGIGRLIKSIGFSEVERVYKMRF